MADTRVLRTKVDDLLERILRRDYERSEEGYSKLLTEYDKSLQHYHEATGIDKVNGK